MGANRESGQRVRGVGRLGGHATPRAQLALPLGTTAALLDALVELLVYPHPLAYDEPENRQRIVELTR